MPLTGQLRHGVSHYERSRGEQPDRRRSGEAPTREESDPRWRRSRIVGSGAQINEVLEVWPGPASRTRRSLDARLMAAGAPCPPPPQLLAVSVTLRSIPTRREVQASRRCAPARARAPAPLSAIAPDVLARARAFAQRCAAREIALTPPRRRYLRLLRRSRTCAYLDPPAQTGAALALLAAVEAWSRPFDRACHERPHPSLWRRAAEMKTGARVTGRALALPPPPADGVGRASVELAARAISRRSIEESARSCPMTSARAQSDISAVGPCRSSRR